MLRVNNHIIEIGHFPDGTQLIQPPSVSKDNDVVIEWRFENNEEMVALMFLARHYKDKNPTPRMALDMPYIPNARQDRVKKKEMCSPLNTLQSLSTASILTLFVC